MWLGLVRHRHFAELGEGRVLPFALVKHQRRRRIVPGDLGAVGEDRVLVAERRTHRDIGPLDPGHRAARIGAEAIGRDVAVPIGRGGRRCVGRLAQGNTERLLEPHGSGERERAAAAEHLLQCRKAEFCKLGQRLPGDAATGDFLTNGVGDLPALLGGKLLVRRSASLPLVSRGQSSRRTIHHKPAQNRPGRGGPRRPAAEQGRSFRSRQIAEFRTLTPRRNRRSGVSDMTTCDEIEADKRSEQPGLIRLVLFFVMQGVAVILVGFAALFLSFEPVWSAERLQAAYRQARRRALRLAAPQERTTVTPMRRGSASMSISPYRAPRCAPASPRFSAIRRRTGSRPSMSIRCRRAARSIR